MTKQTKFNVLLFFRNCTTFFYFSAGVFLTGCVAKFPVSAIYADDVETNSHMLWPEIVEESDTQLVKIRPLENVDEMLLFELEVTNKSQQPIPITPKYWQLGYFSDNTKSTSKIADQVTYPLNGTEVNKGYQKVADKIQTAKNGTDALIVLGVILIIFAIFMAATDDNDNSNEYKSDSNCFDFVDVGVSGFALFNQSYRPPVTDNWTKKDKIAYFRQRGRELAKVDHGPHTIPPGETYFYGLFFPRNKAIKHLTLNGFIGDQYYEWNFQHDGLNLPKARM